MRITKDEKFKKIDMRISLTNIVGVELVDTDEDAGGGRTQEPSARRSDNGELALVKIVNQAAIKLQT